MHQNAYGDDDYGATDTSTRGVPRNGKTPANGTAACGPKDATMHPDVQIGVQKVNPERGSAVIERQSKKGFNRRIRLRMQTATALIIQRVL